MGSIKLLLKQRLFGILIQRMPVRTFSTPVSQVAQQPHIYSKTYTEEEFLDYLHEHVVFENRNLVVTCVPQGVRFLRTGPDRWKDSENLSVCHKALQDLIPQLCEKFKSSQMFVAKHPRRCASGLLVFAKDFNTFSRLRRYFMLAEKSTKRIYTYLALVMGCSAQTFLKTFKIEQGGSGDALYTEVLEYGSHTGNRARETRYEQVVIDSTKDMTLLKICVSYDLRDCVRHILAQKCFTPVFGDFWSISRTVNFLFGAPITNSDSMQPQPYKLSKNLLETLHLSEDQQKIIPIHLHLYGVKLPMSFNKEFFVSTPPTDSFVWTCNQLGLLNINSFVCNKKRHKVKNSEGSVD